MIITARQAAKTLVAALGIEFGELMVSVAEGEVTLVRHGTTVKPEELDRFEAEVPAPRPHVVR